MANPDRRTTIDGDQITDHSIRPEELDITNLPEVDGYLVAIDGSGADNKFKLVTPTLSNISDLAVVQIRRTSSLSGITSFTDINFDTTDIENDTSVVEHNNTNTDRVLIKESGLYLIGYSAEIDPGAYPSVLRGRVRVNDTTTISQSATYVQEDEEITNFNAVFVADLTDGDFVTVQIQGSSSSDTIQTGMTFFAIRMQGTQGAKGDKGDTGSGTNISVKEDNITIPNTPHDALNFEGGFRVSDEGSGQAKIEPPVFGTEFQYSESNTVSTSTSTSFINKLDFDTLSLPAGTYRVEVSYGWNYDLNTNDFESRLILDNDNDINDLIFMHRQEPKDSANSGSGRYSSTGTNQHYAYTRFRYITLTAGVHNLKLAFRTASNNNEASIWDAVISIYRVI